MNGDSNFLSGALGFRPFFVLAGLAGTLLLAVWVLVLNGAADVGGTSWHAHELLFGFFGAVVGGFFLTATPRWTKQSPVTGAWLALLCALWGAGRVVNLVGHEIPWPIAAAVDASFPACLAAVITFQVTAGRSRRNALFPAILWGYCALNVVDHAVAAGFDVGFRPTHVAVYCLLGLICIFGGRITPLFTRSGLKGDVTIRDRGVIDDLAIAAVLMLIPAQLLSLPPLALGATFIAAAVFNGIRMRGWCSWATRRKPIVWILHAGYAWLVAGLALGGLATLSPSALAPNTAMHALTVGCLGSYALGMMSRVTRGHTGRALQVPHMMALAYVALSLAALIRVGLPTLAASHTVLAWSLSGTLWAFAFGVFVVADTPKLLASRPDGRPG